MDELELIKYKWLSRAGAYSDLYDELNETEYSVNEIKIMLLAKMQAVNEIINEVPKV